jgi:predicted TPR repeat methyltransferase
MTENKNCLVCNSHINKPLYQDTLLMCEKCGFITANMELSEAHLKEIYTENYFKGEEYLNYVEDKEPLQHNFQKRVKGMVKAASKENIQSVLEIGCAYGFFGEVLMKELPKTQYVGLDVVSEPIEFAQKQLHLPVYQADYLQFKSGELYTDICMWDVIEHLQNPQDFVKKAYNELADNGRIYITTGDISGFLPKIQKQNWRMIHPPSHLQYFSNKTLCLLLENQGFTIQSVTYPTVYRSLRQIFYSLFMLNKKYGKLTDFLYRKIPRNFYLPFNTFDIMLVTAIKRR